MQVIAWQVSKVKLSYPQRELTRLANPFSSAPHTYFAIDWVKQSEIS